MGSRILLILSGLIVLALVICLIALRASACVNPLPVKPSPQIHFPVLDSEHTYYIQDDCDNYLLLGAAIYQPSRLQRCPAHI